MTPRVLIIGLTVAVLGLAAGCATPGRIPSFSSATIRPETLKPGDRALITADIRDRFGIVKSVVAIVRENPDIEIALKDDGVAPDLSPGDGVWTVDIVIPFEAPAGEFTLDVRGINEDGEVIAVPGAEGSAVPLSAEVHVSIHFASG